MKTCLVDRYLHGSFKYNVTATVGAAFGSKKVDIGGRAWTLGIWDTAGAERYESMSRIYYRSARAAIVCYDLTRKESFEKVKFWVDELLENEPECLIFIVGTKYDLVQEDPSLREVDESMLGMLSLKASITKGFITSAKTGYNVDDLFFQIAEHAVAQAKKNPTPPPPSDLMMNDSISQTDRPTSGCPCGS